MPEISWIKLATAVFDDEKMLIIDSMPECDAVEVMWIKLICQAGKCNAGGWIWLEEGKPYTDEMLSAVFRRPLNTVRLALDLFKKLGMIEINEYGIFIPGFSKHNNLEAMEKVKDNWRKASERYRNKHKTSLTKSYDVIPQIREEEKRVEENREDIIFKHWNGLKIHSHRGLTDEIRRAIKARLKEYSADDLCKAISNYAEIVLSPGTYYWTHRWTLKDFLARGIEKFLDAEIARQNYLATKGRPGGARPRSPRDYIDPLEPIREKLRDGNCPEMKLASLNARVLREDCIKNGWIIPEWLK